MKKDEIIAILRKEIDVLNEALKQSNKRIDHLLAEVKSLRKLLENKQQEEQKQKRINKGLSKLLENKSEKQTPSSAPRETIQETNGTETKKEEKKVRSKTNSGAKRKQHCEMEVEVIEVEPDDVRFDATKARLFKTRDVIRYELIPMRFIKKVYRVKTYTQDNDLFEGKAPDAPFLNSQYDGSFIAGMAQLRYIYSMPVERIIKMFNENGFDMEKPTAHGLLRKTETLFENLYKALGMAIKEDDYISGDETYHKVLVETKNKDGKGIKKGYVWAVTAMHSKLTYYFYDEGSRSQSVILNYIKGYNGTFQSDGFAPYRKMAEQLIRLACFQHVKRKFLDADNDFDCQVIVRLINHLYHQEHKHQIGIDEWTEDDNLEWRKLYAPPIMRMLKKKLEQMKSDPELLPKSDKYEAVHYMLNEWDALENIFKRGDYKLDNNLIERLNRYISLSRRNSLFFGSHKGAERSAMFYSLATTCRLHSINFFEYISDVINQAATMPSNTHISKYRDLLPDRWKQNR